MRFGSTAVTVACPGQANLWTAVGAAGHPRFLQLGPLVAVVVAAAVVVVAPLLRYHRLALSSPQASRPTPARLTARRIRRYHLNPRQNSQNIRLLLVLGG